MAATPPLPQSDRGGATDAHDVTDTPPAAALTEAGSEGTCACDAPAGSEARFRALSESAPVGIFEADAAGRCTYCNPAMGEILERPIASLLGLGWTRVIHPDDRPFLAECWLTAVREGVRWGGEVRLRHDERGTRWIRGAIAPQKDPSGQVCRVVGTIEDVTASRHAEIALLESEERFKLAARAVSDVVWDHDLTTGRVWRSESYEEIFGGDQGCQWQDRIHPDDRERVLVVIAEAQQGAQSSWAQEYRYRRTDGSYAHVHDRAQILRDPAGQAIRMIGGMTDLSERKKLEAQYLRAQRMESIGTLAGGIAHDLNNVLTPILMSINLLRSSVQHDPMALEILRTVETSTRRGADLVRQVLSFARGFGGGRATINLRHLIKEVISMGGEAFPPSIRLVAETPKDLWLVSGDATQLHQVLMNLAVNARDAMPQGGTLTFAVSNLVIDDAYASLHPEAKRGPHVVLKVTDTGCGMPPAVIDRIFEPFFTTKEVGHGTGLGLSTVHAIVKGHDGFITVYSEPGRGTTFLVHLPADPKLNPGTPPPPAAEFPRGRGERILVIDDEASIRSMAQQTLEAFGYRVSAAADGAAGVALFHAEPDGFDLVLTDMLMPVMDGATAIQAIVKLRPQVRVIAASGLDANSNLARAAASGVRHFLPKPYTAEAMLRLVRSTLDEAPAGPPRS